MHQFLAFIFGIKLYMFRTVPRRRKQSANLYDIYLLLCAHCKIPDDGQRTVRNMWSFIPKINLRN